MMACEQMPGMSVLEHGHSVHRYFMDLMGHVLEGRPLAYEWKLPDWAKEPALWEKTTSLEVMRLYQTYHDCGKPACREIDADGRVHFPNHASVSARMWRSIGGDEAVARLIERDMDIHLLKAEGLQSFLDQPEAPTLLLTGLAEIHSNASMFGGIGSTSFKMKWKQIDRRGKQITAKLK